VDQKKFILLYVVAGLGAAIVHFLVNRYLFMNPLWTLLGASGAVAGVMMGAALYFPNDEDIIFPLPIPIKIKYLVIFYTVFEIYNGLTAHDDVAHFAHVGGLLFGFIYIKLFGGKSSGFGY
jgi:membrane associated rhomboid family serine protease